MTGESPHDGRWVREDRVPTLAELTWLRSAEGRSVCREMAEARPADTPAGIAAWRRRLGPARVAAAWAQVGWRAGARAKFSRAAEMLFDRIGLEQATDETVAAHKARRFAGVARVADLCCGIGGDTIALAEGRELVAVDWSEPRLTMAEHNASVYSRRVQVRAGEVTFIRPEADAIHIDPDRRPGGTRHHDPRAGSPGLEVLAQLVRHYQHAAIKLSPGADFSSLPFDGEIELISRDGQCRQAVLWTGQLRQTHRRATVLPSGESIAATASDSLAWPSPQPIRPGCCIFEPDPAVIRADLVGPLARMLHLAPIDRRIAYLLGDRPVLSSLLASFRVIDVVPWSSRSARGWLMKHGVGELTVKTRGFAARPERILASLKLKDGPRNVLFLTRVEGRPIAILAQRLSTEAQQPSC